MQSLRPQPQGQCSRRPLAEGHQRREEHLRVGDLLPSPWRLVGARSIIADWRYQLSTTLEDMCRVRARNLKDNAVGGRWLKAINAEKNIYELVISFPPLSPTQSQSAFDSDATVY